MKKENVKSEQAQVLIADAKDSKVRLIALPLQILFAFILLMGIAYLVGWIQNGDVSPIIWMIAAMGALSHAIITNFLDEHDEKIQQLEARQIEIKHHAS